MEKIKVKVDIINNIKKFLNTTRSFESDIDIMTDRAIVDAKSLLGVMALNLVDDTYVRIISDNDEEINRFKEEMKNFE